MRPPVLRQQVIAVLQQGEMTAEEIRRRLQLMHPPATTLALLAKQGILVKRWDPSREIPRRLYRLKEERHA